MVYRPAQNLLLLSVTSMDTHQRELHQVSDTHNPQHDDETNTDSHRRTVMLQIDSDDTYIVKCEKNIHGCKIIMSPWNRGQMVGLIST